MNQVCKLCRHLILPGEVHVCPTSEYTAARDELVKGAAEATEATEAFTQDELEKFAEELRKKGDHTPQRLL